MAHRPFVPNHEPVFLNPGASRSELELKRLEALRCLVTAEDRNRLERDIRLTQAGISGERKIIFELQNGHYPLVFIHDLTLECGDTSAQIDFLVVTPFNVLLIECKNLLGDIEIDESGTFIRTFGTGKYRRREAIYSPIAQSKRHIELIKAQTRSSHGKLVNLIQHYALDDYYHSVVVLANEKTILTANDAPRDVVDHVIRAEALMDYIADLDKRYAFKNGRESFDAMTKRANRWLSSNAPRKSNLSERYQLMRGKTDTPKSATQATSIPNASPHETTPSPAPQNDTSITQTQTSAPTCPLCGAPMVVRVARYGARKGKSFWGCTNYGTKRCKGIINIEMKGVASRVWEQRTPIPPLSLTSLLPSS